MLQGIPTLLSFAILAGVFWAGHHYEWKLPKYSQIFGAAETPKLAWCSDHSVPDAICVECKPELMPKPKPIGFCPLHGVAECVICHPELAQTKGPPTNPKYDTVAAINLLPRGEKNNSRSPLIGQRVQFVSPEAIEQAGIDIAIVEERPMIESFLANAEVVFDPTHVARLSSKASGVIAVALKKAGDVVDAGETLALIDSAAVGQAKSQLAAAFLQRRARQAQLARLQSAGDAIAGRLVTEAKASAQEADLAVLTARQSLINLGFAVPNEWETLDPALLSERLRFAGLPEKDIASLPPNAQTANLIPVVAPFKGTVIAADSVAGEVVEPGKTLFTVADPNRLWIKLAVSEEIVRYIKAGLDVEFTGEMLSQPVKGSVSWISPIVDEKTRTVEVRVVVEKPDRRLRRGMFGSAKIILRDEPKAIVVPKEAVQKNADGYVVFVRDKRFFEASAPKVFHARQVTTGARTDTDVELLAGVLPGEIVASKGSTALMAQLLKASLGAGCGCHEQQ